MQAAACLLLAADGYLRPSEASSLREEDFYRGMKNGKVHWPVVVAPLLRDKPVKNRQFDDGYTVGA